MSKRYENPGGATLCSAHRTNGEPCSNFPIRGSHVCRTHGGAIGHVKRKARERILEAADPAAAKLVQLMNDTKVPYNVQLAAARDLLDRAGLAGVQEVQIVLAPWQQLLDDDPVAVDLGEVAALPVPAAPEVVPSGPIGRAPSRGVQRRQARRS